MSEAKFEGVDKKTLDIVRAADRARWAEIEKIARQLVEVAAEHKLPVLDFGLACEFAQRTMREYLERP